MRRSGDAPRAPKDRQRATSEKVDEVARAVGRGTTAMRDSAGNVLEMNPAAPYPLLTPQGIDGAVAFMPDGTIKMTSADTGEDRDMTVRDITSSGDVFANRLRATGDMNAANFRATGQTTCNNLGANSANLGTLTAGVTQLGNTRTAQINTSGDIYAPGFRISTDPGGEMRSLNYYGGFFRGVYVNTSDARLKQAFCQVNRDDVDQLASVPVYEWEYSDDSPQAGSGRYVGPVAQDMPAVAVTETEGVLGIDQVTYTGLLLALVQRQGRAIARLEEQVADLQRDVPRAIA